MPIAQQIRARFDTRIISVGIPGKNGCLQDADIQVMFTAQSNALRQYAFEPLEKVTNALSFAGTRHDIGQSVVRVQCQQYLPPAQLRGTSRSASAMLPDDYCAAFTVHGRCGVCRRDV